MRKHISALLAASLLFGTSAFAQGAKDVGEARQATERWIKLIDAEEYAAAWNTSAESTRKSLPKMAWTMVAGGVHLPLGSLKARTLQSSELAAATADKPESVTFVYLADYENAHKVTEKYTATREPDGVWRVSGFSLISDDPKSKK